MTDISSVKDSFLESITSQSGNYKRITDTPMRYAGGKSLAVGTIVENLPSSVNKIVSPFIGGGSVEVAIAKRLGIKVEGYDIFDLLVNYWQNQISNRHELANILDTFEPSKEFYSKISNGIRCFHVVIIYVNGKE
jgi:DNA adenine methylase